MQEKMSSVARRLGGRGALHLRCESATHSFTDDIVLF